MHLKNHQFDYDLSERLKRQDPYKILEDIGLRKNMVFMDIGCYDGFFLLPALDIVGVDGFVYGIDVDDNAINKLNLTLKDIRTANYSVRTAKAEDTIIKENEADIIFLGTVLHDFENPLSVLKNCQKMLKADGYLINLDWQDSPMAIGPPEEIRISIEQASKLIEQADLEVAKSFNYDKYYYIIKANRKN